MGNPTKILKTAVIIVALAYFTRIGFLEMNGNPDKEQALCNAIQEKHFIPPQFVISKDDFESSLTLYQQCMNEGVSPPILVQHLLNTSSDQDIQEEFLQFIIDKSESYPDLFNTIWKESYSPEKSLSIQEQYEENEYFDSPGILSEDLSPI